MAVVVGFDETHIEGVRLRDSSGTGCSKFGKKLEEVGYKVEVIDKDFIKSLNSCDILIIAYPTEPLSGKEIDVVRRWISEGGGVFLLAEWANIGRSCEILNTIISPMGIQFEYTRVIDVPEMYSNAEEVVRRLCENAAVCYPAAPYLIRIKSFVQHPITESVKVLSFMAGCSINCDMNHALALTSDESFADIKLDSIRELHEKKGPLVVGACTEYNNGRVVCFGDTNIITNWFFDLEDNQRFCLNIIKWLKEKM